MNFDWNVIVPGVGLLGLAVYQLSSGDYAGGVQTVFAALAVFGVKVGFDRNQAALKAQSEHILQQNERILTLQRRVDHDDIKHIADEHVVPDPRVHGDSRNQNEGHH